VRTGIRAEGIEKEIGELFADVALPTEWETLVFELVAEGGDIVHAAAERERLAQRLDRAQRALLEGLVPEEMARREIHETEAALRALAPPDEGILEHGEELLSLPRLWPRMTVEEQAEVVQATLATVAVNLESGQVAGFAPRPHLDPLFRAMSLRGGPLELCVWRPRSDSNRRSPP
jgi:hypothetical protein